MELPVETNAVVDCLTVKHLVWGSVHDAKAETVLIAANKHPACDREFQ